MSSLQMRLEAQRQRLPFSTNLCLLELCLKRKFNKHQLSIAMTKAILRRSFYIRPFLSVFRVHSLMCRKKNPWLKKMDCRNLDRFKQSENGGPMSRQALQIKTQIEIQKKILWRKISWLDLLWLPNTMAPEVRFCPPWGCWPRWEPEGRKPRHRVFQQSRAFKGNRGWRWGVLEYTLSKGFQPSRGVLSKSQLIF